ncbi:MAG: F0F1 ATP synthase subunit epsilon [Desulfohalobiaceae bacterium]|jgi:F-type H+-transporting ATPase subunit epsilon|nr:F0F1 ATP synthase subunit epsilon [Desulfohalobiaceae bacterium]
MADTIKFEVVTPDQMILSEDVDYVGVPGVQGQFGVLSNHIPFLSALAIGSLYYRKDGQVKYLFVSGGFAEVSPDSLTILAESAEKAEDIDLTRAQQAKERAEARVQREKDKIDFARAQGALRRAMERINLKEKAR